MVYRTLVLAILYASVSSVAHGQGNPRPPGEFLVSDYEGSKILRFDSETGNLLGTFAIVDRPAEMAIGPDGLLYVSVPFLDGIAQFDLASGMERGFIQVGNRPRGFDFGANGNLFTRGPTGQISEFSLATGSYVRDFTSTAMESPIAVRFGPDGNLYVARGFLPPESGHNVMVFNGQTGAFLRSFGEGVLHKPQNLVFSMDGDAVVANQQSPGNWDLIEFDRETGAVEDVLVAEGFLINPQGIHFLPNGDVLVATGEVGTVGRFDPQTRLQVEVYLSHPSLLFAAGLVLVPEPSAGCLLAAAVLVLLGAPVMRKRRYVRRSGG